MDAAFQTGGQTQPLIKTNTKHGDNGRREVREATAGQAEGKAMPGRVRQKEMYFTVDGKAQGFLKK